MSTKRFVAGMLLATTIVAGDAFPASSHKKPPPSPPDSYVTDWDAVGTQAFSAAALSPAEGHLIFAYVSIAVYDAVMAVEGGYEPFAVRLDAPEGASAPAAVAAAARRVLNHYLPAQQATVVDPAYAASLATLPDDQARADGVATGEQVAQRLIDLRADDGFRAAVPPYVPPDPPVAGAWLPTAPTPPIGRYLPFMTPFSLHSPEQFRPNGPPALWSRKWARDYNEVQTIGSATSRARTPEQTVAARFWAEAPVQQIRGAFRKFVRDHGLDIVGAARFLAMVSVTYGDAFIACFDAKYHHAFWRPITAVRAGDTDGNAATIGDPAWSPLLPATPNHPEYPSAHSCITPAAGIVIQRFLRTPNIDFTIPSLTGLGDRHFDRPGDLRADVSNARVWGGIHFRSAVKDGATIAKKVARWVLNHHFQPSPD